MTKITPEELVRFLYKETSNQKTAFIREELQTDWNLRETLEKLEQARVNLKKIELSPRKQSIDKILEYAAKKQNHQLHSI